MIDALHISESGLKANQKWIDHISNNVANMQTAGFKKSAVQFVDMVGAKSTDANAAQIGDATNGQGTRIGQSITVFSAGPVKATGESLDVAINGSGFLEVMLPEGGMAYTRLGKLKLNNDGQLTTVSGYVLADDIRVPSDITAIEIDRMGNIRGKAGQAGEVLELGQLRIAHITNPESMEVLGEGLFATTQASGEAVIRQAGEDGAGELMQGYLEMSNVDLVEEMTNLVMAQRAYQLNARIIQTVDQVMETINNLRR